MRYEQVNPAVNLALKCIFVAIPKNGTTSVRSQISSKGKAIVGNPHINIMQIRDLLYPWLLSKALRQNKAFPARLAKTDAALRAEAKTMFDSYFKFAAVRNPWARTVSLYFRTEGVQMREKMSFEEFCSKHRYASDTSVHPTIHQNQIDWLTDETGAMPLDYIYKAEEFEQSMKEIEERTNGRIKIKMVEKNQNPNSKSKDYKDMYSPTARDAIAKAFEKDIDTFKFTF